MTDNDVSTLRERIGHINEEYMGLEYRRFSETGNGEYFCWANPIKVIKKFNGIKSQTN